MWEDFQHGMYDDFQHGMYDEVKEGRTERVQFAYELLSSPEKLHSYMQRVAMEWKYATEQTFTNPNINHQAFLGQTACNLYAGCKEDETREAWGLLTNEQRYAANHVADMVYDEWIKQYERAEGNYQMTFEDLEGWK